MAKPYPLRPDQKGAKYLKNVEKNFTLYPVLTKLRKIVK